MTGGTVPAILATIFLGALGVAFFAFILWLMVRVLHKAGFSGWWCLIWLVPFANFVMLWVFAFARWPRLEQSRAARGER
jgi:uncharacterized membrane protein YhaH (DUF805 family)